MKKIFQNKIAKPLMLISVSLFITAYIGPDDELMNKEYTYSQIQNEICQNNRKHCVDLEEGLFFVEEGFLFKFDKNLNRKEYTGGFEVKEIVEHSKAVIALQEDGDIYLRVRSEFFYIGNRGVNIESNGKDLVALVRNGTVWIYQEGEADGQSIAFEKSEFTNVQSIDKGYNSIIIELESGEKFHLR